MISVVGPQAERILTALPPELDVVAFDVNTVQHAFIECMRRRELGQRFYALPLADDLRLEKYTGVAAMLIDQIPDADMRYAYALQLGAGSLGVNGAPASALIATDPRLWDLIYQTILLSDGLLVRSFAEYTTYYAADLPGHRVRRILLAPSFQMFEPTPVRASSVVIWAGRRPSAEAAIALIGSAELRTTVTYIGDVPLPNTTTRYLAANDPAVRGVLAAAGCIVCIDRADPADAVAFARLGKSVVAPITSGAVEFEPDIVTWDAVHAQKLYRSVAIALGRTVVGDPEGAVPATPPALAYPVPLERLPLVSIVTPTYNRPAMLRNMLTCIAAQTYPNIESVVVNDAGTPVNGVVAEFRFARLFDQAVNGGTLTAMERGLAESRGEYIGLLPDDDWLYPDHVERLMKMILASGSPVAHASSMLRFLGPGPTGCDVTTGYNGRSFSETVNPTAALVGTPVAHHQVLQRKDTYAPGDLGWFLKDTIVADQEFHMRLTEKYQLVWDPAFTCEFRDHAGNSGKNHDWASSAEELFDVIQPRPGRPIVSEMRRLALESMRATPRGENVNRPSLIVERGAE